jgi:hypothetical protein
MSLLLPRPPQESYARFERDDAGIGVMGIGVANACCIKRAKPAGIVELKSMIRSLLGKRIRELMN